MIIYLDESGDLGLNFSYTKTSRYLVIGLLVFPDGNSGAAHKVMMRAVKRTLKNKLPKYTNELKGNKLTLPIKSYFLKMIKNEHWFLYTAIADKRSWLNNLGPNLGKKRLYNEISRRLLAKVSGIEKLSQANSNNKCNLPLLNSFY